MTEAVTDFQLRDFRGKGGERVKTPTVHIAKGYDRHIPFLALSGRPIVCISDWQCEPSTQRYFWKQTWRILRQQIGGKLLERAVVVVAGDMASKSNALRGAKSDDAPDFSWLQESFPPGDILIVYGNHDHMSREHLYMNNNASGVPCLLLHGNCVGLPGNDVRYNLIDRAEIDNILDTKIDIALDSNDISEILQHMTEQERKAYYAKETVRRKVPSHDGPSERGRKWDRAHPEQARLAASLRRVQSLVQANSAELDNESSVPMLRIGAVHGIPASHNQGLHMVEREEYFRALDRVCDPSAPIDVLVTHYMPCLPGPHEAVVRGDDSRRLYVAFLQSQAFLHVCGHMHLDPPVSILSKGKVVANADCRVIVFGPPSV